MCKGSFAARLACAGAAVAGLLLLAPSARSAGGWGTVKGQVVWGEKDLPKPKKENVTQDKGHCLSKGPIFSESLVVDPKTKGVKWAVVWLVDAKNPKKALPVHPKLKAVPKQPAVVDQPCCKFEPHVLVMREGQKLILKNSAPVAHNSKLSGGALGPDINPLIPPKGQFVVEKVPARLKTIPISCNIHPWMKGWLFSLPHPYFAVTNDKGEFTIKDAPAGTYKVVIWHEEGGWVLGGKSPDRRGGKVITIKADGVTNLGKVPMKKLEED
jgi:hypothetical protein